jgi:hypothetical protein
MAVVKKSHRPFAPELTRCACHMQRVYIDLGKIPHPTRAALSGDAAPSIGCLLGAELDIGVHFFRNNTQEALAGSSTGKLTLKAPGALAGPALFLDATMTPSGSGAATVYKFSGVLSSDELVADLGELTVKTYRASIAWTEPTKAEAKCSDFDLVIENSSTRPDDTLPATTDARWQWIKEAAPETNGFTHDDETKTLSVEAGGGTPDAHAASHGVGGGDPITIAQSQVTNLATDLASKVPATRTVAGKPLSDNITLAKADVGLGNVDNTSDANKPISTATANALSDKLGSEDFGTYTLSVSTELASKVPVTRTVAGKALSNNVTLVKADVGLGNVDNTSDASKPISTATQTALNGKAATNQKLDDFGIPDDNTDLNATTSRHGLLPKLGGGTTNFLRADGAWAAPSGGGSGTITMSGVAFVDATVGNNATAEIGNPAKPYVSAQAAVNAGATILHIVGNVGSIESLAGLSLHIIGIGKDFSAIQAISAIGNIVLTGNGQENVRVNGTVRAGPTVPADPGTAGVEVGAPGSNGAAGATGSLISVYGMTLLSIVQAHGQDGGNGGDGGPGDSGNTSGQGGSGGDGGLGGSIYLTDCIYNEAKANGGNGGPGGESPDTPGSTGRSTGGNAGGAGSGGTITLLRCHELGTHHTSNGQPGAVGPGSPEGQQGSTSSTGTTTVISSIITVGEYTTNVLTATIMNGVFYPSL